MSSRGRSLPLLITAALGVVWGGSPTLPAGAAATSQERDVAGLLEEAGVRLLALDEPGAVAEYFRNHRVAVAEVHSATPPATGTWIVTLGYTSVNFGGEEGGSTVWFPQDGTLTVTPEAEETLAGIDWRRSLLVLELREEDDEAGDVAFEVVGVAAHPPSDSVELDWFADKPELLHRGHGY